MRDCSTLIAICGVACAASLATAQPTFTDESAARLPASLVNEASLTEKDYGMGDLDGDGDIDIVVGLRLALNFPANLTQAASTPNVLLFNDGTGVFTDVTAANAPALAQSLATRDILVHDLDADGDLDIIVANGDNDTPQVLLNDGSGVFTDETAAAIPGGMNIDAWTVSAGDVLGDGDGADDVYFGVRAGNPPVDRLLINQGVEDVDCFADCNDDGNLNILDFTCYQGLFASGAAEADCNGDGNLNILDFTCFQAAFSAGCPEGLGAWLGFVEESGRLGPNGTQSGHSKSSALIDMNGDGDVDLVTDYASIGQLQYVPNDGTGNFSPGQLIIGGAAYNFGLGHLDNDGIIDFYGVRNGGDQFRRNLGAGFGDFLALDTTLNAPASTNGFGAQVRVADVDGSGTDDFLVTDMDQEFPNDCSRRLNILTNPGTGLSLTDAYPAPVAWEPNGSSDVLVFDIDGDGKNDLFIGACNGNRTFIQN